LQVKKMKHRSTHIFILVVALLVAAPRASQELSAMKDALGNRLKSEIFSIFLSLHATDATRPATACADGLLADASAPRAAKQTAAPARPATQVEVHARREVPAEVTEEVSAITEPGFVELARVEEPVRTEAPAFTFELHDPKVIRGRELAMIIPPDADVTAPPPPPPPARQQVATARRAHASRRRAEAAEHRAASFNVKLDDAVEFKGFSPAVLRRRLEQVETLRLDADTARTWTKVLKLRKTAPKPAPAAPPARAACPKAAAEAAPAVLEIGCGPAFVEAFYASE
jgi:hypothetical protein